MAVGRIALVVGGRRCQIAIFLGIGEICRAGEEIPGGHEVTRSVRRNRFVKDHAGIRGCELCTGGFQRDSSPLVIASFKLDFRLAKEAVEGKRRGW